MSFSRYREINVKGPVRQESMEADAWGLIMHSKRNMFLCYGLKPFSFLVYMAIYDSPVPNKINITKKNIIYNT